MVAPVRRPVAERPFRGGLAFEPVPQRLDLAIVEHVGEDADAVLRQVGLRLVDVPRGVRQWQRRGLRQARGGHVTRLTVRCRTGHRGLHRRSTEQCPLYDRDGRSPAGAVAGSR